MDSSQVLCLSVLPSPLYSFGGKSAAMVTSIEPTIRMTAPIDKAIFVRGDIGFRLRIHCYSSWLKNVFAGTATGVSYSKQFLSTYSASMTT